jgi:fatty acid desaturase
MALWDPFRRWERAGWEWPTCVLVLVVYGGWLALTWHFARWPLWLSLPLGTWLVAWHNSLQHETIHQHPTPFPRLNTWIGAIPLGLWLPYEAYRQSHLQHHLTSHLTDPFDDPESFYRTPAQWQALPRFWRGIWWANFTLAGRLVLGPAIMIIGYWYHEAARLAQGDRRHVTSILRHAAAVAIVLTWLAAVGMPPWLYIIGIVYPAVSLGLLRSYAEHLQAPGREGRTAIVRAGPLLSLLYLRNNLHVLHHARPQVPWYRLRWSNDAPTKSLYFTGYGEIFRRFLLRPIASPIYAGAFARPPGCDVGS